VPSDHVLERFDEPTRGRVVRQRQHALLDVHARPATGRHAEDHGLLHRGERIGGHGELVGPGRVAGVRRSRQLGEEVHAAGGQGRHVGLRRQGLGKGPPEHQLLVAHHGHHVEEVGPRRVGAAVGPGRRPAGGQRPHGRQRGGARPSQVVDTDLRGSQAAQRVRLRGGDGAQFADGAVGDAVAGHGAQALADREHLVGDRGVGRHLDGYRAQGGEPAHEAGGVQVGEQGFAAVAFDIDQHHRIGRAVPDHVLRPLRRLGDRAGHHRDQGILDPCPQHAGQVDEPASGGPVDHHPEHPLVPAEATGRGGPRGQADQTSGVPQPVEPPAGIRQRLRTVGPLGEAAAPGRPGRPRRRQHRPVAALQEGRPHVVQQDLPGHEVDHQMVGDDQQLGRNTVVALTVGVEGGKQIGPDQHSVQAQGRVAARRHAGQVRPGVMHLEREWGVVGDVHLPVTVDPDEAGTQGVVAGDHRRQGGTKPGVGNRAVHLQQHRLVVMRWIRWVGREGPPLDRQQRDRAARLPRPGPRPVSVRGRSAPGLDRGRQFGDALVLEQVRQTHRHALTAQPPSHLEAEDGVATEMEEVALRRDRRQRDAQHVGPDLGDRPLQGADEGPAGGVRGRRGGREREP